MVHHDQQDVFVRGEAEQPHPDRQLTGQVEAVPGRFPQPLRQFLGAAVGHGQRGRDLRGRQDDLDRAGRVLAEHGAQALVPGDDVGQGGGQRRYLDGSVQAHRDRHVVRRGRPLDPVQEPESLLGEGERHPVGARHDGLDAGAAGAGGVQPPGQPGHGRGVEQVPDRQLDVQHRPDPADQPGGQQRMPAQVEERVVDTHLGHPEHLGEQAAQDFLAGVPRTPAADRHGHFRRGQFRPVHLAVDGERELVDHHDRGRHHVVRQGVGEGGAQGGRVRSGPGLDVADQAAPRAGVRGGDHQGPVHPVEGVQHGFDLAQFDPETADLHLVVGAAHVLQHPGGTPPDHVAGAVHPGAGLAVRVGDEPPTGQPGPAQIAAGQSGTGDIEFAGHPDRHRQQAVVEHVQAQVRDALTDQAARFGGCAGADREVADMHRGLGDAVHVHQRRPLTVALQPRLQPAQVQSLPAEDDVPQVEAVAPERLVRIRGGQLVEGGRGLVQHRHPLLDQQPQKLLRRPAHRERHHHQAATGQQRPPQLPHREVERRRMEQRPHIIGIEPEPLPGRLEQPHHIRVGNHHTLRPARRAGGVDDVRRLTRLRQRQVRRRLDPRLVQEHHRHARVGHPIRQLPAGQHQHRGRVLHHEPDPVRRIIDIHRHIRAAGAHHRQ
nr:linear gramicidin synthetase subunit D [bacterium]